MNLHDFHLEQHEYRVLYGAPGDGWEFQEFQFVSSAADLIDLRPGAVLFLTSDLLSVSVTLETLLTAAVRGGASGIVLPGTFRLALTKEHEALLASGSVFVLALSASLDFYRIICRLQNEPVDALESAPVLIDFRMQLAELCAKPYTVLDIALLLNQVMGRSVDILVGPEIHSLTHHDTLGLSNVARILSCNLNRILSCPEPQIYCNQNCRALVVRILDLCAFVMIPLKHERQISRLELAMIMEAIPYLALALSRDTSSEFINTLDSFYQEILWGEQPLSPLSLREAASFLGINSDIPRYIWILECQETLPLMARSTLKRLIQECFPTSYICTQARRFVVISTEAELFPRRQPLEETFRELFRRIAEVSANARVYISISKSCADLYHLKKAFNEAKFSMIIGPKLNPQRSVHDFRSYLLYQALCNCWGAPVLEKVHQSIILPIRRYDAENRLSLLSTLEQFAACAFNIARAAEAMQVHRNTLYRRISKIGTILNLDMNASDTHILIYIALQIDKILQIFPQTETNMSWTQLK